MTGSKSLLMREGAGPSAPPSRATGLDPLSLVLALIAIAGFLLRLWCARGDLWLDEIWSYRLAAQAPSMLDVLFALPYDNNHVLNTLWLKLVGAGVPPQITRLPAILSGTLSICAAAYVGRRDGKTGAIIFASIFAFDFAFLGFESEARGYAGLIFAFLLGFLAIENIAGKRHVNRNLALFGLSICFGMFSHLTMIEPAGIFCLYGALSLLRRDGINTAAVRKIIRILAAAALGLVPVLLCVIVSLLPGVLHVGRITPFSLDGFMEGLGLMVSATIGFPTGSSGGTQPQPWSRV